MLNLQTCGAKVFLKRDINTCVFLVKFAKFLRASSVKTISELRLLYLQVVLFTMHEKDIANEAQLEPSQTDMIEFFGENS